MAISHTLTLGTDEKATVTPNPQTAALTPASLDGPNPQVVYTSSEPTVASVSQFFNVGTVTAVSPGTAVITAAASSEGIDKTETINVTVESRLAANLGLAIVVSKK